MPPVTCESNHPAASVAFAAWPPGKQGNIFFSMWKWQVVRARALTNDVHITCTYACTIMHVYHQLNTMNIQTCRLFVSFFFLLWSLVPSNPGRIWVVAKYWMTPSGKIIPHPKLGKRLEISGATDFYYAKHMYDDIVSSQMTTKWVNKHLSCI